MSKQDIYDIVGFDNSTKAYLKLNSIGKILAHRGLSRNGSAQAFHTANVMRRMVKYMPMVSGATIKIMATQTDVNKPYIFLDVPYGKFLYYGKVMVGDETGSPWAKKFETKHVTPKDLTYNMTNPLAGPFWDRRLMAAEGEVIASELQSFINKKGGKP